MNYKEQFPDITRLAEPHIVKSPFDVGRLAIAYPYTENGEWMHKDEMQKYFLSKKKVMNMLTSIQTTVGKNGTNLFIYDLIDEKKKEL